MACEGKESPCNWEKLRMLGEAMKKECWSFPLLLCKLSLEVMLLNSSVLGVLQRCIDLGVLFI